MPDDKSKGAKKQAYLARLRGETLPEAKPEAPAGKLPAAIAKPVAKLPKIRMDIFHDLTATLPRKKIPGFSARIGTDTVKRIGDVVGEHPDKALAIFRTWMSR